MLRSAADGEPLSVRGSAAQVAWLLASSAANPRTVQSYVSPGFQAYARVLNPAFGSGGSSVRWSTVARQLGANISAETQWSELSAGLGNESELDGPDWSPDAQMARTLTATLRFHTATPDDCYFLVWEGYAGVDDHFTALGAPRITTSPGRTFFLLAGSLQDACEPILPGDHRLPNWWWPADHEWCVGNEIYARSCYLGGSRACIDEVLAQPDLEAYPISPDSPVTEELQ